MRIVLASLVSLVCLAPLCPAPVQGAVKPARPERTVLTRFRLHVLGRSVARTTFWVAYGPLADRWGLVRLHAARSGRYAAIQRLPANERTVFAYLAGSGVVATPLGPAPGNPVVTIRLVGPTSASHIGATTVQWHVPTG